jgi:hypothetical protein
LGRPAAMPIQPGGSHEEEAQKQAEQPE